MFVFVVKKWFRPGSCYGPFIILRRKNYHVTLLNHEYIHYKQQLECLFIFAPIIYMLEFLVKLVYYKFNSERAYMAISFERESYMFQHVLGYANNRKNFVWIRYIYYRKNKPVTK